MSTNGQDKTKCWKWLVKLGYKDRRPISSRWPFWPNSKRLSVWNVAAQNKLQSETRSWDSHHFILDLTIAICNNSIDYRVLQWRSQCFLSASSFFFFGPVTWSLFFYFSLSRTWYTTCTSFTCYSRTPVKHRIVFTHTLLILVIRLRDCTAMHQESLVWSTGGKRAPYLHPTLHLVSKHKRE